MPISRVRSLTAIVIVLTIENAPTSSAISALPKMIASKICVVERMPPATSAGSRACKPVSKVTRWAIKPVSAFGATRIMSAVAGGVAPAGVLGGTSCPSNPCASGSGTTTAASKIVNDLASMPTSRYDEP